MNPNLNYILWEIDRLVKEALPLSKVAQRAVSAQLKILRKVLTAGVFVPVVPKGGGVLLMDPVLVKRLKLYLKVEGISERDWKAWTPLQQASTWGMLATEWKPQIADRLLELYKAQYPPKPLLPRKGKR